VRYVGALDAKGVIIMDTKKMLFVFIIIMLFGTATHLSDASKIVFSNEVGRKYQVNSEYFIELLQYEARDVVCEDAWLCWHNTCIDIGRQVGSNMFELDREVVIKTTQKIPDDITNLEVKFIHNHPSEYQDYVNSSITVPPTIGDYVLLAALQLFLQKRIKGIVIEGIVIGRDGIWKFHIPNTENYNLYDFDQRFGGGHPYGHFWSSDIRKYLPPDNKLYSFPLSEAVKKAAPQIIRYVEKYGIKLEFFEEYQTKINHK